MGGQAGPTVQPAAGGSPLRVMVVDDSAVIRGFVGRWLAAESDIEIVATANNGVMAVREAARVQPEIVVLDIEMPEMDGLTALPAILREVRQARVLMSSTLTHEGAEATVRALSLGAADYLTKPSSTREPGSAEVFRAELLGKIRALGEGVRRLRRPSAASPAPLRFQPVAPSRPAARASGALRPQVIAIGSSTGGPQALTTLLAPLASRLEQPILITQHMPAMFTAILAQQLAKTTGVPAAEAQEGEPVQGGRIYVAPGNHHMTVERQAAQRVIRLNQDPPENYCRPSVDPMLRSVVSAYGPAALAVILTGMGQDGLKGGRALVEAGGTLIAQDEATSVVWGMPGAVANAGLCHAVLPLGAIGAAVERLAGVAARAGERA